MLFFEREFIAITQSEIGTIDHANGVVFYQQTKANFILTKSAFCQKSQLLGGVGKARPLPAIIDKSGFIRCISIIRRIDQRQVLMQEIYRVYRLTPCDQRAAQAQEND